MQQIAKIKISRIVQYTCVEAVSRGGEMRDRVVLGVRGSDAVPLEASHFAAQVVYGRAGHTTVSGGY